MAKKKVKKDAYQHSILTDDLEHCLFCGRDPVQFHHIFGGSDREISTEDDQIVPLCWECHMKLHTEPNQTKRYELMRRGQRMWETLFVDEHNPKTTAELLEVSNRAREEFRKRYGKSYL